ncbi:hypothetical protein [uncultured Aeromicrobium sp.]|uniref:hypothetical protein n=1 Tax=uncultured Aeromicrobium sp. TaxID=337820 RepID=UPI0026010B4E|nr:hypothetical protein [uncultured Aeromicrobium sp.]
MRTRAVLTGIAAMAALALVGCGSGSDDGAGSTPTPSEEVTAEPTTEPEPTEEAPGLAEQVEAAFSASYGWPAEPSWSHITSFDDRDAPRVTVVTELADKPENAEDAMGTCRAVASVSASVDERFTGVYVTAGEGGAFIAECDTAS